MVELERFLNYCDVNYQHLNPCRCGDECRNGNYCLASEINCYKCIRRVHHYYNSIVHYNCTKMLYCYVLKHSYRFAAEIFYLIQKIQKDTVQWDDIYITSIGCGPCTELFGALFHWRSLGKQNNQFHFRGFDNDPIWAPLMEVIPNFFYGVDVRLNNIDVFEYYRNQNERVDVLILNYMLSDMLKFHSDLYPSFLLSLCEFVENKHPRYLLINDVYLKVSVNASMRLLDCFKEQGVLYKNIKLRYHGNNPYIGEYGRQIERQPYEMRNQAIVERYDPFRHVDSIQTIIMFQ